MQIDSDKFLFLYANEFGTPNDNQRGGLLDLLGFFSVDRKMDDPRWIAYCLATTYHEVKKTWLPIREDGRGKGKPYGKPAGPYGLIYYGRGLTQNTWLENYEMLTKAWNKAHPDRPVDFVKDPDLLLEMEYSYFAMSYAMRNGTYTGVGLARYINADKCDYINARRIVNILDCAERIASYARRFERILSECVKTATTATV